MNCLRMSQLLFHCIRYFTSWLAIVQAAAATSDDDDDNSQRMMCVQQMSTHNKSLLVRQKY